MTVAGIGCRRGCGAEAIMALLRLAEARTGCPVARLAVPAFKRNEAGPREAAAQLGLSLQLIDDAALAAEQARCPTRSAAAARATGFASIAEAAALAAAGPGGRLLLPRLAADGATCALAASAEG